MSSNHRPALFRALGDPTRLAIFELLAQHEHSVSELVDKFEVTQPAISQHLAALRSVRLVNTRRIGRNAYYRARPEGLKPVIDWLRHYQDFWPEKLENLKAVLDKSLKEKHHAPRH
ncbi:MAG: helix-turn-helix transcriptional regulator [Acidobacteriaceae bacterium]|nr:helix-turn-helix transcriptional regulator [Acidobacteriaceae bacterium]